MKWQKSRKWIIKYVIVWIVCVSINLASAQEFTLGQEKLLGEGIFSPDGNLLAVKTVAGVLLFDTVSLRPIQSLSTQGGDVTDLAFSPDGCYLAWSDFFDMNNTKGVGVWDLVTFAQVAYFSFPWVSNCGSIIDVFYVPDGELLAARMCQYNFLEKYLPSMDAVHFWKVSTWEDHGVWDPHGTISNVVFTHDSKQFTASTIGYDGVTYMDGQFAIDVQTLETVSVRENIEDGIIAYYSPDGRFEVVLVHWNEEFPLLIRDTQNHNLIANLSAPEMCYHCDFSFSPDNKWLLAAISNANGELQQLILWNTQTWEIDHRLTLPNGQIIAEGFVKGSYWCAELTPTGELRLWDLIKGKLLASSSDPVSDVEPVGLKHRSWGVLKSSELLPSYPNPANPETWIPFVLHKTAEVKIRIYDIAGNLVRTLRLGNKSPGAYLNKKQAAYWDGKNDAGETVGSGIYFYQMRVGNETFVRKALLLK